jgi:hypothetical protein
MDKLKFLSSKSKSNSLHNLFTTDINQYHYIDDFDKVHEDECILIDKKNTDIYKKNCELYKHLLEKIKKQNAIFKIDNPPLPPLQPNNHSKYVTYKLKNSEKNVRLQTFAVLYLIENNYSVTYEKNNNHDSFEFEPYEAIELCEKKFNDSIENIFKKYQEHKIFLRKSMSINIPQPSAPNMYPSLERLEAMQKSSYSLPTERNFITHPHFNKSN